MSEENPNELNAGDTVIFHLTSGITLVAKILSEDENGYLLEKPMQLSGGKRPDESLGFGLMPYLSMEGLLPQLMQFYLPFMVIMFPRPCPTTIANAYVQLTSGIQVAKTLPPNPPGGFGKLIRP